MYNWCLNCKDFKKDFMRLTKFDFFKMDSQLNHRIFQIWKQKIFYFVIMTTSHIFCPCQDYLKCVKIVMFASINIHTNTLLQWLRILYCYYIVFFAFCSICMLISFVFILYTCFCLYNVCLCYICMFISLVYFL